MDKLKSAIEKLADRAIEARTADDAMKFAQAALNAANAYIGMSINEKAK